MKIRIFSHLIGVLSLVGLLTTSSWANPSCLIGLEGLTRLNFEYAQMVAQRSEELNRVLPSFVVWARKIPALIKMANETEKLGSEELNIIIDFASGRVRRMEARLFIVQSSGTSKSIELARKFREELRGHGIEVTRSGFDAGVARQYIDVNIRKDRTLLDVLHSMTWNGVEKIIFFEVQRRETPKSKKVLASLFSVFRLQEQDPETVELMLALSKEGLDLNFLQEVLKRPSEEAFRKRKGSWPTVFALEVANAAIEHFSGRGLENYEMEGMDSALINDGRKGVQVHVLISSDTALKDFLRSLLRSVREKEVISVEHLPDSPTGMSSHRRARIPFKLLKALQFDYVQDRVISAGATRVLTRYSFPFELSIGPRDQKGEKGNVDRLKSYVERNIEAGAVISSTKRSISIKITDPLRLQFVMDALTSTDFIGVFNPGILNPIQNR